MIERTTMHPFERKRNKTHIFVKLYEAPPDVHVPTGLTKCGRTTYVGHRTPRPKDTRCKLCFRSTKRSAPVTENAENTTTDAAKTAVKI